MTKEKIKNNKELAIFQAENGAIELKVDAKEETIWATQSQIAELFSVTPQNITIHLKNVYRRGELDQEATCKESLQVQVEGKRKVKRKVKEYNLDVLISVGYSVGSAIGTNFRKWATKTLKDHITKGFTINPVRIEKNYQDFLETVEDIKLLAKENKNISSDDILELVKTFSSTWFSLESYDRQEFPKRGYTKKDLKISIDDLYQEITKFKKELLAKNEATELFAQEKNIGNLKGILGNVMQSVFGKDAYETVEEKAAHLLYFIIKNHPFNDGNKRTGAFSFIWFLQKATYNFKNKISPETLTVLTLLIAESNPKDKDKMIGLVLLLFKE